MSLDPTSPHPADKLALRAEVIAARARLGSPEHAARSLAACERLLAHPLLAAARTVGVYAALGAELDPSALADRLVARGVRVAYPRIRPGERRLAFASCTPGELVRGPRSALEPPASAPALDLAALDLLVVPGVAFTEGCLRLGRGGGFYDATLAALDTPRIGLAFELQIVPTLPREAHDVAMDAVVTEARTLAARPEGR